MAEVWPAGSRASGMGLGYGVGNFGKIISPLGLALIVGGTNVIKPEASVDAIIPAMFFLAFWAALAAAAFVVLGIETKGRSIEEIDAALTKPSLARRRRCSRSLRTTARREELREDVNVRALGATRAPKFPREKLRLHSRWCPRDAPIWRRSPRASRPTGRSDPLPNSPE
jgi:hypothetical protein